MDLLRGDNSLEKLLESSCLGQLNKIFNPCGKVHHSVAQDSSIEMGCNDENGRFHILSLLYILFPCHAFLMLGQNNGSKT